MAWGLHLGSPLSLGRGSEQQTEQVREGGHTSPGTGHGRGRSHCSGTAKRSEQSGSRALSVHQVPIFPRVGPGKSLISCQPLVGFKKFMKYLLSFISCVCGGSFKEQEIPYLHFNLLCNNISPTPIVLLFRTGAGAVTTE